MNQTNQSLFSVIRKTKSLLLIVAIIAIIAILLVKCKKDHPKQVIAAPVVQTMNLDHFNDSTMLASQEVLIAETQEQLHILQTTLSLEIARKMKINKITAAICYRDSIVYRDVPGEILYRDTSYGDNVFPLRFKHANKYLTEYYSVHSKDSASIDSLSIVGKQHLVIGETGKWYQTKRIKIGIVNENPYFTVHSLRSVVYKPKDPVGFSVGPIVMVGKSSASMGIGMTAKKGMFSFTLGYKFF